MYQWKSTKVIAAVRMAIRNAVPEDIRSVLPLCTMKQTPADILEETNSVFENSSDAVHRQLEAEANGITLTMGNP